MSVARGGQGTRSAVTISLVVLSLLAVPLSGCLGDDGAPARRVGNTEIPETASPTATVVTEPVTVITDPAGDATEHNSESLRNAAPCVVVRDAPEEAGPAQCAGYTAGAVVAEEGQPAGGVPAHPARDLLEVRFQETPQVLIVEMDIAALEPSLDGAADRESGEGTRYLVSWTDPISGCTISAGRWFWGHREAVSHDAWMYYQAPTCLEVWEGREDVAVDERACPTNQTWCVWNVPGAVTYGQPATLRWEIPRDWLPVGDRGVELLDPQAETQVLQSAEGANAYTWVDGPVTLFHVPATGYILDRSEPGNPYRFQLDREPWPASSGPLVIPTQLTHVAEPASRPDVLMEGVGFHPREESLRFTVSLAEVEEDPRPHEVWGSLDLPGQRVGFGSYVTPQGEWGTWAFLEPRDGEPAVSIPVELQVQPGTPGRLVYEVARSELLPIAPNATVLQLFVSSVISNNTQQSAASHRVIRGEWGFGSLSVLTPRHTLEPVEARVEVEGTASVNDPYFDVEMPPDMVASSAYSYDVLGAHLLSSQPGEMRFTLSVDDLSNPEVPPGYDGLLYALAVEHPRGTDMVGYYLRADQSGGVFFCAPDTTVFATPPAPPPVTWTQLAGRIARGGSSVDAGGTTGASAIQVSAPSDCFGLAPDAPALNVSALKGGSYVIRRGTPLSPATVEALDTVESDGGFLVPFAQPVTEQPSFLSKPFGIENFWDILGLIVAIITVLVTLGIFLRRRRTFHRYLDEIRRIQETYRTDATARATALVEIRYRLNDDLEAHRISDSHYPIVLDRLRARLTSARLTSLGQRFYDVPGPISRRIERLLDDGYLAEEEAAVLEPVIQASGMPAESTEELLARLRTWVEEDRHEVVA